MSLKHLLFLSSQTDHQMAMIAIHQIRPRLIPSQALRRRLTKPGKHHFKLKQVRNSDQIDEIYGQKSRRWSTDSSFFMQQRQMLTMGTPLFLRLSIVRIFLVPTSQAKAACVFRGDGVIPEFEGRMIHRGIRHILILLHLGTTLWDCVRAEPIIYKKIEASSGDVALLRAFVGDRPTWRNPNHPWRVDPRFKLTGVPTLIRWENDAVGGRLEDHEAHVEHKINALIASK